MDELEKTLLQFKKRYGKEYDTYLNVGIKINDGLLFINSAIIAVLVASEKAADLKYTILLLFVSTAFSLLSLFFQKELSRKSAEIFLIAHVEGTNAKNEGREPNLPSIDLRKRADAVSLLINLALLSFFVASLITLLSIFCS